MQPSHLYLFLTLLLAAFVVSSTGQPSAVPGVLRQTWIVNENIVNFYRPANRTERGGAVPREAVRYALLVNDSMPGPAVTVTVGQAVNITVLNRLSSDSVAIHWHGIRQTGTPWSDGADFVSQCPTAAVVGSTSYVFTLDEPGTYFWHSHLGMQIDQGLVGALIVLDPSDPHRMYYDMEFPEPLIVQEWYWDPVSMLKAPAFRNFNTLDAALINGRCASCSISANATAGGPGNSIAASGSMPGSGSGPGSGAPTAPTYDPPVYTVQAGLCYRLRLINANGDFPGWQLSLAAHNLTLIALDARNLQPVQASSLVTYGGNRADLIFCADQPPGDYPLLLASVQQRTPDCPWYPAACQYQARAVIRYGAAANGSTSTVNRTVLASLPYVAVLDPMRRTRDFVPLVPRAAPPPTRSLRVKIGFLAQNGPAGTLAFAAPVKRAFVLPSYPLLFASRLEAMDATSFPASALPPPPPPAPPPPSTNSSAGAASPPPVQLGGSSSSGGNNSSSGGGGSSSSNGGSSKPLPCGMDVDTHTVTVTSEAEVLELILDNLTDLPHNMHMHGGGFYVLGTGVYAEAGWLGDFRNQSLCPPGLAEHADEAWLAKEPATYLRFWGCIFSNSSADRAARLEAAQPYLSDMVIVPPRGWAVVRLTDWHSGVWPLHCHTNHHALRGMQFLLNVLPAARPVLPAWVDPFCGFCSSEASLVALATSLLTNVAKTRGGRAAAGTVVGLVVLVLVLGAACVGVTTCLVRARQRLRMAHRQRMPEAGVLLTSTGPESERSAAV